jgi:hypothetical protein
VFPVGIGLRDPRSPKRDLGHPSVSPFDIAEGTSFVISLLMTKRRVGVSSGNWFEGSQVSKRDLGHPSVSSFDTAEGTSFVISLPTLLSESAAPRDDKEEGGFFQWELV